MTLGRIDGPSGILPTGSDPEPQVGAPEASPASAAATVERGGSGGGRMAVWTGMSEPRPLPDHMWAGIVFRKHASPVLSPAAGEVFKKAEYFLHTGLFDRDVSRADAETVLDLLDGLSAREWATVVDTLGMTLQDGAMLLTKLFEQGFEKHPDLMDRFVGQCVDKLGRTFEQPRLPGQTGEITEEHYKTFLTDFATGQSIRNTTEAWTTPPSIADLKELPGAIFQPFVLLGLMGLPFHAAHKVSLSVRKALSIEP